MVTKEILAQYCDLQEEIKEVRARIDKYEREIAKLEEEGTVKDKVTGGEGGWQSFVIEGFPMRDYSKKKAALNNCRQTLKGREDRLLETLNEIEMFLDSLDDSYIRRIIDLRFLHNMTWAQVARAMGNSTSEKSIKMTFYRFMEKNS